MLGPPLRSGRSKRRANPKCCHPACALLSSSIHSCLCGVARSPTLGSQEGSPCSGVSELITGTESLSTPERVAAATVRRDRSLNPDTASPSRSPRVLQKSHASRGMPTRPKRLECSRDSRSCSGPVRAQASNRAHCTPVSLRLGLCSSREWRPRISRNSAGCGNTAVLTLKGSLRARLQRTTDRAQGCTEAES